MDDLQPVPEERRWAQQPCNGDERRARAHFYAVPYDQETETATEAQLAGQLGGQTPNLPLATGV